MRYPPEAMLSNTKKALGLCALSFINWVLFYGLGVFLARELGVGGFKAYSVAIATLTLLASFATLGLEKYAVRVLPALYEREDWAHARGFTIFSRNLVMGVSLGVVAVFGVVATIRTMTDMDGPQSTTVLAVLFLPIVVGGSFLLEVLAANGEVMRATIVYRFLLPAAALLSMGAIWASPRPLTALAAVGCYCLAWLISFLVLRLLASRSAPAKTRIGDRTHDARLWLRRSMPFLVHGVMMTQFASLGIVGLGYLGGSDTSIAVFAAAMQTGGFVILLATSTNRLYGPITSLLIEHRDYQGMRGTIRERHTWIIPSTLVFLLVVLFFGRRILLLYGPEFESGYAALCWIAAGGSVSVWFAMAPSYLKYVGKNALVLGVTAAASLLNVALLVLLGPTHGATGAAAAYAISLATMAVIFLVLGLRTAKQTMTD